MKYLYLLVCGLFLASVVSCEKKKVSSEEDSGEVEVKKLSKSLAEEEAEKREAEARLREAEAANRKLQKELAATKARQRRAEEKAEAEKVAKAEEAERERERRRLVVRHKAVGEKIDLSSIKGERFKDGTITKVTATQLRVTFPSGPKGISMEELPSELQERFMYEPEKAKSIAKSRNEKIRERNRIAREESAEEEGKKKESEAQRQESKKITAEINRVAARLRTLKGQLSKAEKESASRTRALERSMDRASRADNTERKSGSNRQNNAYERERKVGVAADKAAKRVREIEREIRRKRKELERLRTKLSEI